MDIAGTANTSCKLVGHEQVTVPAGTYIAAEIAMTITMKGTLEFEYGGYIFTGTFTASQKQTAWGVPDVGIVKVVSTMTEKISIAGAGSVSITMTETDELTDCSSCSP